MSSQSSNNDPQAAAEDLNKLFSQFANQTPNQTSRPTSTPSGSHSQQTAPNAKAGIEKQTNRGEGSGNAGILFGIAATTLAMVGLLLWLRPHMPQLPAPSVVSDNGPVSHPSAQTLSHPRNTLADLDNLGNRTDKAIRSDRWRHDDAERQRIITDLMALETMAKELRRSQDEQLARQTRIAIAKR